jgi:predicted phosphohydrolase
MKIGVVSDLHLEFGDLHLHNHDAVDVLILGGDVCVASKVDQFRSFFAQVSACFPRVVYIMGNHEHYHGWFDESEVHLRRCLQEFTNITILEKQVTEIDGVVFLGATLWTDFNRQDPVSMWHCRRAMNDYNLIRIRNENNRRLLPQDVLERHQDTVDFLRNTLPKYSGQPVVVSVHHAPSPLSVHEHYRDDVLTNGGYASDLSELILEHPQIKLVTHGHTHHTFDYCIGSTRVVCNPRGYWGVEVFEQGYTYQLIEV